MALVSNGELAGGLIDFLGSSDAWLLAAAIMVVLLVVDLVLVAAADRRFRRGMLIARSR
jgi:ABC-type glycerol-3-phosphate transport system permease component